ncbi:MAG TPA: gliding motility lipoprotein GldH, partial [Bacteroidales bacterium]|nr:gliding motility lipoprotein GldH [Bacteroidales bacterium]
MRKNKQFLLLIFLLSILSLVSCDKNRVFETNIEMPSYIWNKDSVLIFHVDIIDTISSNNMYLNVRNTSQYAYQNLFVFLQTTSPAGLSLKDTLECYLADDRGKWLGDGWGDIY